MTLQDLGSIGELIAAIATVVTLGYLAVQMRQNTRALRSATFQEISRDMNGTSEVISTHADLSEIMIKGQAGLAGLTPAERTRYSFLLLMTLRRLESVFMQRELGSLDRELTAGFERSVISAISSVGGREWWQQTGRFAFSDAFVGFVDHELSVDVQRIHPGFGQSLDDD
jgi:hypothetical protein